MENISLQDRIRLFNGDGSWKTFSGNGKFPFFVMSDGPHGLRKQDEEHYADINESKVATCYPTASCSAASWDRALIGEMARCLALEALKEKVDVVLGCGINIKRSPLCGRNFEYFSEDPYLTGELAASYINGVQKEGVGTSLKHFACNNQETRRQTGNSIVDERTLAEIYLRGFEKAVKQAQPYTIMSSYNRVNGEYVGRSKFLLDDFLRKKWGFKGAVISDWGACIGAAECVEAGMDLAMPDSSGYLEGCLNRAFNKGKLSLDALSRANDRILNLAEKLSLSRRDVEVDYSVHHDVSRKVAEGSAVLLKNEGVLPLVPQKICVIGELAEFMKFQGGGSSHITTAKFPNALESLGSLGFDVQYAKGYFSGFCKKSKAQKVNAPLANEALSLIKSNKDIPILFFCGLTESYEGEGFDRVSLDLPLEQQELLGKILEISSNVILVSFSGAPIVFPFRDKVKAILHMYLCGEGAGEAVANLICGKVNPSGKLAETFPLKIEDTPCFGNFALKDDNIEYREQLLVGYRYYDTLAIPVEYEFGYGLSYTSFSYESMEFDAEGECFNVTVKNTGERDGAEIVQLYVVNPEWSNGQNGRVVRARKELRGFGKIFLKKGESGVVSIPLDENAFSVYSNKLKKFVVVDGNYTIEVGSSISDVKLSMDLICEADEGEEKNLLCNVVSPVTEVFYEFHRVTPHCKGEFTVSDSLGDMSKHCSTVKFLLWAFEKFMILSSKSKSLEDPAVKITLCGLKENPAESLISTGGGAVSEKFIRWIVKKANR